MLEIIEKYLILKTFIGVMSTHTIDIAHR